MKRERLRTSLFTHHLLSGLSGLSGAGFGGTSLTGFGSGGFISGLLGISGILVAYALFMYIISICFYI